MEIEWSSDCNHVLHTAHHDASKVKSQGYQRLFTMHNTLKKMSRKDHSTEHRFYVPVKNKKNYFHGRRRK